MHFKFIALVFNPDVQTTLGLNTALALAFTQLQ